MPQTHKQGLAVLPSSSGSAAIGPSFASKCTLLGRPLALYSPPPQPWAGLHATANAKYRTTYQRVARVL